MKNVARSGWDFRLILSLLGVFVFVAYAFDLYDRVNNWLLHYEYWQLDEIFLSSTMAMLLFAWYAWRRQQEAVQETQQRQRSESALQEAYGSLEHQVAARTQALTLTNQALQVEVVERIQAEEQLRYQANLLANVSDAIISIDLEFTIKSWNKAAEALYGWSAQEAIGKSIGQVIPTEYIDGSPEEVIKQIRQAGQWQGEVIQQGKDGTKRHILSTVTRFHHAAGNLSGAVALSRDITEQVQITKALQASQQLTQATLNSLSAHICVLDETGMIVATNDLWRNFAQENSAIMEKVSEGVNYLHVCEATQDEDRPAALAFAAGLRAVLQHQRDYFESEYACHSPQEQRWFMGRVTPLVGSPINQRRVVVAHENITALKRLATENEQLTTQFYQAQKMESLGQLAGGIAHDFNNLLVPILGYAEMGMLKLTPDSHLYGNLKRIKEAGERAARLTRQILAFSRQQVLEMKTLDLNRLIREFEPMLQCVISEDICLQLHLADPLPALTADKGQLEQVLLNLVVNACDAMPDGGRLMIETSHVVLDEAYAAKHPEVKPGSYLLLTVSDTGDGMDATTQQRIFEPFFTTKALGKGTGLGLSTVFGIVKQHQGIIWVYSKQGRGTTFRIYLPVVNALDAPGATECAVTGLLDGTETVLLVEDEDSVRQLVGDALRAHGYQVLEAGEPEKGLALAAAHASPIDLLLTDVIMPKINGWQLAEQLASVQVGVKVLYMSGYIDNVSTSHHVLREERAFLQKPFTIDNLLQKVRTVLG